MKEARHRVRAASGQLKAKALEFAGERRPIRGALATTFGARREGQALLATFACSAVTRC